MDFWRYLFSGIGFVPRTQCGAWSYSLIALHVISDTVIWLAYLWIPLVMIRSIQRHRRQLTLGLPVLLLCTLYVIFITACGWTHFFDALMFFDPVYRLNGIVRMVTAIASAATAVSIVRLIPAAISAPVTIYTQGQSLRQQRRWLRDILDAATDGVLKLCESPAELPASLPGVASEATVHSSADLRMVRHAAQEAASEAGFPIERTFDLISALHEATMNALVHAGGGNVTLRATPKRVQVWVRDSGAGIPLDRLPISTLKQGYSTAGTAGQGWFMVLTFVDRAYLLTGPEGTTVVLEVYGDSLRKNPVPFSYAVGGDVRI